MSNIKVLRDHSQPCEHEPDSEFRKVEGMLLGGYTIEHGAHLFHDQPGLSDYWVCGDDDCPGGKEITLRLLRPGFKTSKGQHISDVWVEVDDNE